MGRVEYTVDTAGNVLRMQNRLPTDGPVNPLINDVVNLKAQYGIDANCDGVLAWQDATGTWSSANVPTLKWGTSCVPGVPSLRQIRAVRIAIVTRSSQYEKEAVTLGPLLMLDDSVSMTLSAADQHYRYKVLETSVPLRNAMWN
jgi:type IV pilus assembly protein PilW